MRKHQRVLPWHAATVAFLLLGLLVGCTGENLFTGPGAGGGSLLGPAVEITEPAADAAFVVGDSVRVTAEVSSDQGVSQVSFSGAFTAGGTAFGGEVIQTNGAPDTTVSVFLNPVGGSTGNVRIVVEASDLVGGDGADTVTVSIN